MEISRIVLHNFGSYEGHTSFETATKEGKNIILIGGKNGAGKTTLFTAMRVCLYGCLSMGYKNFNSRYSHKISKLINNQAKMSKPASASITMHIELSNGRGVDHYILTRSWLLSDSVTESFSVDKNDAHLSESEVADFEKYLLSLIPPALFDLYFFDGERIADFFLDEGSNSRIKDAFLTLCGYDTFDIMRRNFRRISKGNSAVAPILDEYLSAKDLAYAAAQERDRVAQSLQKCIDDISNCQGDIDALETNYQKAGGITEDESTEKLLTLKEEEKNRETYNALLKHWANDTIPFLMLREQIQALKDQMVAEDAATMYKHFCKLLNSERIRALVGDRLDMICKIAFEEFGTSVPQVLNLSAEQNALILSQINQILAFDEESVKKCKRAIKKSLALTAKIRKELESTSTSSAQEYMQKRAQLFEEKSALLVMRVELEQRLNNQKELATQAKQNLDKVQARLESELKKESINDISARAIIMLDRLQHVLYRKQIERVEAFFRQEIGSLMRKVHFIDDIYIDDNFNIHAYRMERIPSKKIVSLLRNNSLEQITATFGTRALSCLKEDSGQLTSSGIAAHYELGQARSVSLPVEIDISSLSNGEKQIFIMALYHSLISLCSHEVPFVIDTPFARIDTEHRANISRHFFSTLKGQIFILSTNEEIDSTHVQILQNRIAAMYMLENADNKKTVLLSNTYFEV